MGAKATKGTGAVTPVELVIKEHPDHEQEIRLCMKKWHKRGTGKLKWPREGIFMAEYFAEVEASIKQHKAGDNSKKALAKRARERQVLRWFSQEGQRQAMSGAQMPGRSVRQNSFKEKHTLSGMTEKEQNQPSVPQFSESLPPNASDTDTPPAGQNDVRPGMTIEMQEENEAELSGMFSVTQAKEIEEDPDNEFSSDVSEITRKGSVRGNLLVSLLAQTLFPTPEPKIERKCQDIKEERLEHILEQMTLEESQKMERQEAAAEARRSYPLGADIHPTPVTHSPQKPTCTSGEDHEQVTGCESETLQLSGFVTLETKSCMNNLCCQLEYIEDTLHSQNNQQEDKSLNQNKSGRHSELQQDPLSRKRRPTHEPTETRRMTLRSGRVLHPPHSPKESGSMSEDEPKLLFSTATRTSGSTYHGPSVT